MAFLDMNIYLGISSIGEWMIRLVYCWSKWIQFHRNSCCWFFLCEIITRIRLLTNYLIITGHCDFETLVSHYKLHQFTTSWMTYFLKNWIHFTVISLYIQGQSIFFHILVLSLCKTQNYTTAFDTHPSVLEFERTRVRTLSVSRHYFHLSINDTVDPHKLLQACCSEKCNCT